MSSARKILEMIEAVSPDDRDTLDEIDGRVWCWLTIDHRVLDPNDEALGEWFFEEIRQAGKWHRYFTAVAPDTKEAESVDLVLYTRSRDALKAIRPEGWRIEWINQSERPAKDACGNSYGWGCRMYKARTPNGGGLTVMTAGHFTEELAELHAIIQAIEYERKNV